jgi:hypothetical protein
MMKKPSDQVVDWWEEQADWTGLVFLGFEQ